MVDVRKIIEAVTAAQSATAKVLDLAADAALLVGPADQEMLKRALANIRAENDEGHRRLQAKLEEAAKR